MGLLLILAQVALIVLDYGAGLFHVSPWAVFLPAILFVTIWIIAQASDTIFSLTGWNTPFQEKTVRPRIPRIRGW